jgi:rhamnose utilization protein RhaD (predicted bifunctional aldolase and dehydrogenase)
MMYYNYVEILCILITFKFLVSQTLASHCYLALHPSIVTGLHSRLLLQCVLVVHCGPVLAAICNDVQRQCLDTVLLGYQGCSSPIQCTSNA